MKNNFSHLYDMLRSISSKKHLRQHKTDPSPSSQASLAPKDISDSMAEALFPPIGRLLDVNGLTVHATDQGQGRRPVILLHGASVNLRDWTYHPSGALAQKRRVIAMDRPGFGYSQRTPDLWTPQRQARHLQLAAAQMGVEKPIVVGHSWGAIVALAWALDAPQDITGVITVSGATQPWRHHLAGMTWGCFDQLGLTHFLIKRYMASLVKNADKGAVEDFVTRAFHPNPVPQDYLASVGAPLSLRPQSVAANCQDLAQTQAALKHLSIGYNRISCPVEIIHGTADWLLTAQQHAVDLAEALPNANLALAEGVGHMAHHVRFDLLSAAIDRLDRD